MTPATPDERWLLTDAQRSAQGMGPWTQVDDLAHSFLTDGYTSKPKVHHAGCYICEDPEFAQMGLPLCRTCPDCRKTGRGDGHIPADDQVCSDCGFDEHEAYLEEQEQLRAVGPGPCACPSCGWDDKGELRVADWYEEKDPRPTFPPTGDTLTIWPDDPELHTSDGIKCCQMCETELKITTVKMKP